MLKIHRVVLGVIIACLSGSSAFGAPWAGSGNANDPYQIWDACDMQAIGADSNYWDANFILCADINLGEYTGTSFNIIGTGFGNPFSGVFDGNGHTISNFTYDSNGVSNIGIFGCVFGENAIIKDLILADPNVNGTGCDIGSLAGSLVGGTVSSCYVEGATVSGGCEVGGLIGGGSEADISNCYVLGRVSGEQRIGGLVGNNEYDVNIYNCSAGVVVSGDSVVAGLVGNNFEGTTVNCYSWGQVYSNGGASGLLGNNYGTVLNCYSECNVDGNSSASGLVGYNRGTISNSYAGGNVWGAGTGLGGGVGGLVARNEGEVLECYASGDVTGSERRVGGLVGFNGDGGVISNCYSSGDVSGGEEVGGLVGADWSGIIINSYLAGGVSGTDDVGGLVGYHQSGSYTECFWDVNVNPDVNGIGNATDPNVIGKTTEEMRTASTFTNAGWDFAGEAVNGPNDIWDICEGTNYPKLVWQIPAADFVCPDGVAMGDFSYFAYSWLSEPNDYNWDPNCDISEPNDGVIDERDLEAFVENWLEGI